MGRVSIPLAAASRSVKVPLPSFVDTGATLIDKSNVDAFMKARAPQRTS